MARRQINSRQIKFENQGDAFVGILKAKDTVILRGQDVPQFTFVDSEGRICQLLGSAGLNPVLSATDIDTMLEIEYDEDMKTGNGMMKVFSIYEIDDFEDAVAESQ